MPALSPISSVPLFTPIQQTPIDESARHTPSTMDSDRASLAGLVDALQEAALPPVALQNLGALILDKERNPCGKSLAMLLHSPAELGVDLSYEIQPYLAAFSAQTPELPGLPGDRAGTGTHKDQSADAAPCPHQAYTPMTSNFMPEEKRVAFDEPRAHVRNACIRTAAELRNERAILDAKVAHVRSARIQAVSARGNMPALWALMDSDRAVIRAEHLKKAYTRPSPPAFLLQFVDGGEHPDENLSDFLLPFNQLAQQGIRVPDDIAWIFEENILPFDIFRKMVDTYVTQLPIRTPEELDAPAAGDAWTDANYWEHALAALCSPLTRKLLDNGHMTPEMLLDWIGLRKRMEALIPDQAARSAELPPPSEFSEPFTTLLAEWHSINDSEFDRSRTSKAAFIRNPEKLRALANSLVPRIHIAYFLSIADSVDWPILEQQMDRVAEQYKKLNAGIPAEKRALFYSGGFFLPRPEPTWNMAESWRNMVPYVVTNTLRADKRLDSWTVAKAFDGDRDVRTHLDRRPARLLFEDWARKKVPMQHQAAMSLFMAQGFDETWADNILETHADNPIRVETWLSAHPGADLYSRLNPAMKTAVARWLGDEGIHPRMLSLVPAMIQSDMSVAQIDRMVSADGEPNNLFFQIQKVFGPHANTPEKILYGLFTPAQMLDRVWHGNAFDDEREQVERQKLRNLSDLSKNAAQVRDHLRRKLYAIEALRANMEPDTPQARQCERFVGAWAEAIAMLGGVLELETLRADLAVDTPQASLRARSAHLPEHANDMPDNELEPITEAGWARKCQEINGKLGTLIADLNFGMLDLAGATRATAAVLGQLA